ncbi:hypothetical protein SPI_01979 [Niveomyces insectorum RCEF 264]|uniref:Uncharacterized protein n=1 Tax=Niveomyces insectorum RCEF 264 TaxID=1081102 RepID=A0A162J877_9HYPO|nr:hypothetical protein SPI_01979 [Niveomyces insectorum RCEF 264]
MPFNIPTPTRSTVVALSLLPVVVPTIYLLAVQAIVSRHVATSSTKRIRPRKDQPADAVSTEDPPPPHSLPNEVLAPGAPYILVRERVVSHAVPTAELTTAALAPSSSSSSSSFVSEPDKTAALLTAYLRGTMEAFSWTPQGFLMRSIVSDPGTRRTFDTDYLRGLDFVTGDVANGAYKVTYRESRSGSVDGQDDAAAAETRAKAELSVVPLPGRPDLTVHAIIVAAVERSATEAVFFNETWMWRHARDEKPTMLEGVLGRWVHGLVGGWMVFKGTRAVTAVGKDKVQ